MAAAVARGSMLDLAIVQSTGTNWLLYFPRSDCVPRARRLPTIYSSLEPHVHACYYLTVDLYALERLRLGLLPSQTGQTPTNTELRTYVAKLHANVHFGQPTTFAFQTVAKIERIRAIGIYFKLY